VRQQEEQLNNSGFTRFLFRPGKSVKRPQLPIGVVIGLILICLGAALLLENLNLIYIEDALQFWPCALIAIGLAKLWNRGVLNVWGQVLVIGGLLLQLLQLGFDIFIEVWWPALVIWIGLLVVIKAFLPKNTRPRVEETKPCEHGWSQQGDIDAAPITIEHENEEQSQ